MNLIKLGKAVICEEIYSLQKINDSFEKAINLLLNCTGRLVVVGMGKSAIIGKKIVATPLLARHYFLPIRARSSMMI